METVSHCRSFLEAQKRRYLNKGVCEIHAVSRDLATVAVKRLRVQSKALYVKSNFPACAARARLIPASQRGAIPLIFSETPSPAVTIGSCVLKMHSSRVASFLCRLAGVA